MVGMTLIRQIQDQREDEERQQEEEQIIANQRRQFRQNPLEHRQGIVNPAAEP